MRTTGRDVGNDNRQPVAIVSIPVTMHWLWAPLGLLVALPIPVLIGSLLIPGDQYYPLFGQPSFLDERTRLVALGYAATMAVIFAFGVPMRGRSAHTIELDWRAITWLNHAVRILGSVTFIAYAVWIGNALLRGLRVDTVVALLTGEEGTVFALRDQYFENLSGVTTWMQLGALAAPLAVLRARAGGRRARGFLIALFMLALVRALLNSERLAIIEITLSTVLAYLILRPQAPALVRRPLAGATLVVGSWAALILVFGAFEFFRSWTYAQRSFDGGFWQYATTLLLGYYATALNLAAFDGEMLHGGHLLSELFQGNLWGQWFGPSPIEGSQLAYGLQTFTNRSGLLVPDVALGTIGGGVVIAATAIMIAILARRTARGGVVAFAVYCSSAVAVLELVRIYYFGSSRFLPVLFASIVMAISWSLMKSESHRPHTARGGTLGGHRISEPHRAHK